jgi:DNA-binding NarL/FixJ family response regulator
LRLLICDDHALFREGLQYVLRGLAPEAVLEEAGDADGALARVGRTRDLDLVLLDLELPGRSGLDALRELRERYPEVPVAIVSAHANPDVVKRALLAGACGFIPKSSTGSVLRQALELIFSGGIYVPPEILDAPAGEAGAASERRRDHARQLTDRQRQVLALLARGLTNREIAGQLHIAEGTVKNHVAAILERLEISNRTEAAYVVRELEDDDHSRP